MCQNLDKFCSIAIIVLAQLSNRRYMREVSSINHHVRRERVEVLEFIEKYGQRCRGESVARRNEISSFAQNLSVFLHLKTLRLGDSEQLVPLYIFQQFAAAIEKIVMLHTLTLGSQVMDGTVNESHGEHAVTKKQKIDDVLLSFWHEPLFTAVTDHIRSLLQQNHSGIGALMSTNQIDIDTLQSVINAAKPEKQVDTCFRLLRLKPDILLAFG